MERTRTVSWEDPATTAQRGLELPGLEYLRSIRDGDHRGSRTATSEAHLRGAEDGKLYAHATSTVMILGEPSSDA
jgi:hypothetical protein